MSNDSVYVAHIVAINGIGYMSAHRSFQTAEQALVDKAIDWGFNSHGERLEVVDDLDDNPYVRSYGVSHLPIEA